ncbi:uracil-DNA glycosylase [Ancylobacter sp. Lp-2]|uniref:uracil-DNA glycosylase n=1 Tax=Ancylobacter sp. Lp-2 TaxID=2881339 RepID=UPI001E4A6347|nr:uracil-DNA glycosylase [Ancylobacter sp. Lp-2]MCB4767101.1 uracil-DNA glycosylase [Ancylobacter sp. Lp-2]
MIGQSAWSFVDHISSLKFENAFNPYSDEDADHDLPGAAATRRDNLRKVIDASLETGVDSMWIARDLGYRGGRRTGLALTDEMHLQAYAAMMGVDELSRSTGGPALSERTARVVWDTLSAVNRKVFLWNVFPLHPHDAGAPMSNRTHKRSERYATRFLMEWLVDTLRPRQLVAIGRDAQSALTELGFEAACVRHPSYGGQSEFIEGISRLYSLPVKRSKSLQQIPLF